MNRGELQKDLKDMGVRHVHACGTAREISDEQIHKIMKNATDVLKESDEARMKLTGKKD